MTVSELIEKLQRFDADAMVVIASFETGFNELTDIQPIELVLNDRNIVGSTHHVANRLETATGETIQAVCVGHLDPSKLENRLVVRHGAVVKQLSQEQIRHSGT